MIKKYMPVHNYCTIETNIDWYGVNTWTAPPQSSARAGNTYTDTDDVMVCVKPSSTIFMIMEGKIKLGKCTALPTGELSGKWYAATHTQAV